MGFRFLGGTGMDGLAPTDWHLWFDDFDDYAATDWIITTTEGGSGSASEAVASAKDGILVITNDNADNDKDCFQWAGVDGSAVAETWKWVAGKPLYFGARFKVNEVIQSDFTMGLYTTNTDPTAGVVDGIFFRKDDGDTDIDCIVVKDSTSTGSVTGAATAVADTYMVLEFYYDGVSSNIVFYKDGVAIGSVDLDNVPDNEELAISFHIQQGEATNVKIMSVDWIKVGQLRGA